MTPMMSQMEELDRGWSWVVLISSFGYFMIFGLFLYGIGMVHAVLLDEFSGKSASTAWAGSLYAALVSLGGPVSSIIIDKFSCRSAMFIDGLLTTVGCLATAFSPNLTLSIFTYGILAGFGGGIGYTATMVVVGFNFRRWRNTALGIAVSGVGVGTCILTPVMEVLRDFYGNAGYFIIMAGIGFHKCLFAVLCKPSRLELARQDSIQTEDEEKITKRQLMKHYAKVYTNKLIVCFSLSLMLFSIGTYMIFLHLPHFTMTKGHSHLAATALISSCGFATIVARVMTSMISETKNIDEVVLYSGSFGSLALGTFLFPLYSRTYTGLVVYSLLLGAYFGGCYAVMNSINIKLVGIKYLSIATGMELIFCAVGTALGPVITGLIVDKGGTYDHAFMIAAFIILIGAALGMATVVFQPNGDSPNPPDVDFVVTNNGDVINETCTASSMIASSNSKQGKQSNVDMEEKQDSECQEFSAEQKLTCSGSGCLAASNQIGCNNYTDSDCEPLNFTEEIQRLLHGEEIKFIDENDDL
ncbi:monocarboxylate transporter 4-like [Ruditapes philippinarum]|uniref:monocarboxylate transporter 4-like n=1 Tax=Ruditapes philippinarum TaxID=129788 RepID=UPI00295A74C4|nr:monocarboxylate transporter 4-like [Ruditapes philippinarum]